MHKTTVGPTNFHLPFGMPPVAAQFWKQAREDDLGSLASALAFKLTLAVFPLLLFVAAIASYAARVSGAADPADTIVDSFGDSLPGDAASVLRREIDDVISGTNLALVSLGALGTLWPASSAARAVMKAVSTVNDLPDSRRWWAKTVLSLLITVLGGLALVLSVLALLLSEVFAASIAGFFGLGPMWVWVSTLARFPIVVIFVVAAAQLIFWLAPSPRERFRWWSPGSLAFGLAWSIFSAGFSFYVAHFGHYESTYGGLASIVVFLIWLYCSCWLLLAGAELDAVLNARRREHTQLAAAQTTRAAHGQQASLPQREWHV